MLGRECVEGQQLGAVRLELRGRLRVLGLELAPEVIERLAAAWRVGASMISCSCCFALGCTRLGRQSSTFAILCTQQRWARASG